MQGTLHSENDISSLGIWKHALDIHVFDKELNVLYSESQISASSLKVSGKRIIQWLRNTSMIG